MRVDPFGSNITTATGVKGGHVTQMHDAFLRALMTETKSVAPSCKGTNAFGTCNGVFGGIFSKKFRKRNFKENCRRQFLMTLLMPPG